MLGRWKLMGIRVGSSCHPLPYSLSVPLLLCTTWFTNHRQSGGLRANPWVTDISKPHTVICIRKINSTILFFVDNVRPKTPPVSIGDIQKVRLLKWRCVVCMHILISSANSHLNRDVTLNVFPVRVSPSHLRRKRRRCRQVLEFLSLWATLSTRRPSTRKTWGKRWSSWCWIRRTAPPLLTVSALRVSIDAKAKCCLSCALITPAWIVFSLYTQTSQQTGRRSCSRSFRSTRWWRSRTTKTTNGTKRSRRCCKPTKAKQLLRVCPVQWSGQEWMKSDRWCRGGWTSTSSAHPAVITSL